VAYDPERHHRRSIRLQGYDYAQPGGYFVTICTRNRTCLFGDVVAGQVQLSDAGRAVEACWRAIPDHFPDAALDAVVIMPNHVHGIIWIVDESDNMTHHGRHDGVAASDHVGMKHSVGAKDFSPLRTGNPAVQSDHVTYQGADDEAAPDRVGMKHFVGAKDFSPLQTDDAAFQSPSRTVGSIVRGFKIGVTKWMRANADVHDVWQRNFFEEIVRDEAALFRIRQYIADNPARWAEDAENPVNMGP
jgi:REP element-mobilizing transposase RayT